MDLFSLKHGQPAACCLKNFRLEKFSPLRPGDQVFDGQLGSVFLKQALKTVWQAGRRDHLACGIIGSLARHELNEKSGPVNFPGDRLDKLNRCSVKGPFLFSGWWHALGQWNFKKKGLLVF
jgi:hypothetical protein